MIIIVPLTWIVHEHSHDLGGVVAERLYDILTKETSHETDRIEAVDEGFIVVAVRQCAQPGLDVALAKGRIHQRTIQ